MNPQESNNTKFPDFSSLVGSPINDSSIRRMLEEFPNLSDCASSLALASAQVIDRLALGGTLFLAGNGGSLADCLHIAGELKKQFEKARPLPVELAETLRTFNGGDDIAKSLQSGLRVHVLGCDPVLAYAVDNDIETRFMQFAQELYALARPEDIFLGISTSGKARNVLNCAIVAKSLDLPVIVLTGTNVSPLSEMADYTVRAPASTTAEIQSFHSLIYHVFCRVIEDTLFG